MPTDLPIRCSCGARDAAIGPVRSRIQARFAKSDRSTLDAHDGAPRALRLRMLWMILLARLRGDQARSPFSYPESGEAIVAPHVLSEEELRTVEAARDAYEPGGIE